MERSLRTLAGFLLLLCGTLTAAVGAAPPATTQDDAPEPAGPMAAFARLVGGEWHIGPLRHVFEWGIGQHTVFARTYDQDGNLASEARWFWHPGEKVIRGYSVDAAGAFFAEMTTRFDGDTLTNELRTFGADGAVAAYTGVWHFTDDDHYEWTLYSETAEGRKQTMAATAVRKDSGKVRP